MRGGRERWAVDCITVYMIMFKRIGIASPSVLYTGRPWRVLFFLIGDRICAVPLPGSLNPVHPPHNTAINPSLLVLNPRTVIKCQDTPNSLLHTWIPHKPPYPHPHPRPSQTPNPKPHRKDPPHLSSTSTILPDVQILDLRRSSQPFPTAEINHPPPLSWWYARRKG